MKIRFSKLMTLVAVLFVGMFSSCAPEEITRVPAKMSLPGADELGVATLTLSSRAETKSMSFETDGDWYIRIPKDCDWLTASPAKGTGNATVNFTTTAYDQLVPRTTKVAFVVDGVEQKAQLEVTQLQQYVVTPTVLSSVVPKTGGEYTVDVATNGTFTVALDNEGKQWLEVVSVESNAVVFNAKPIDASVAKNRAKITFTCVEDEGVVAELNISQKNLEISLDAKTAARDVVLKANVTIGDKNATGTFTFGVIKYADKVLADGGEVEQTLVRDVLSYVRAAYTYFGTDDAATVSRINTILGENYDTENAPVVEGSTVANAPDFKSVTFVLDGTPAMRFYLTDGADATKYAFFIDGKRVNTEISEDGKYIDIDVYAYALCETVTYTVDGAEGGSFHINAYYEWSKTQNNENLTSLVARFWKYLQSARAYRDSVVEN